jgi:TatD DNase family protein
MIERTQEKGSPEDLPVWTDSHNHLAMGEFSPDREAVLTRAAEAGVKRMVVVGTCPEDWAPAAGFASRPGFRATAGLHPHEASRWTADLESRLAEALGRPGVTAVGETGLDYHYDLSPREIQREAFARQVHMAAERRLPLVIHSREAFEDTAAILREAQPGLTGVIHCFTYGPHEAQAFLEMGLHLSFSGIVTFPKAPLIREAALLTPMDRLLTETDAPYLAPVPHRGKRCEPAHAAVVGRFLADLRGVEEAEMAQQTVQNASHLFSF